MSSSLLHSPAHLPPSFALHLSQQAPALLESGTLTNSSIPVPFLSGAETAETWTICENLMISCLRTGDDQSAHRCLQKLTDRFGDTNERVMGLRGLYHEAVAGDNSALAHVLEEYESVLAGDPTNMPIAKRRIALLRSMGRSNDAIAALIQLLDASPTDVEAWSELSDQYLSQSMYSQAVFSLEEVLIITPNAWNIHARMGEIFYMSAIAAGSGNDSGVEKALVDSMRRFCRSIELCDGYLRGYYGLKLTTSRLLPMLSQTSKSSSVTTNAGTSEFNPPSLATVQKLNQRATAQLADIVRHNSGHEKAFEGYDQAEIIAARELLDRDTQRIER
ncbi:MAG: hypothetical protein M1827_003020 [Pycnora praestabilis]|nr:MAG: hypothetical protein M1827_003020 [Pycnora praestabilis]